MEQKRILSTGEVVIKTDEGIYFHAQSEIATPILIDKEEGERLFNQTKEMRVFRMNECDWVCAESEEQAKSFYLKTVGFDEEEIEEDFIGEVSLQDTVSEQDGEFVNISFEQLIERYEITEPCIIASTEY